MRKRFSFLLTLVLLLACFYVPSFSTISVHAAADVTTCPYCGAAMSPATDANGKYMYKVKPTCTKAGSMIYRCTRVFDNGGKCGGQGFKSVPATGHDWVAITSENANKYNVKSTATCTKKGDSVRYCKSCHKHEVTSKKANYVGGTYYFSLKDGHRLAGKPESGVEGVDYVSYKLQSKGNHVYTSAVSGINSVVANYFSKVTKQPTTTKKGTKKDTCLICGKTHTTVLSKLKAPTAKAEISDKIEDFTAENGGTKKLRVSYNKPEASDENENATKFIYIIEYSRTDKFPSSSSAYSTNLKLNNADKKKVFIRTTKSTSLTVKKLKAGKYYVRVRYGVYSGAKRNYIYSKWSSVKSVTIK